VFVELAEYGKDSPGPGPTRSDWDYDACRLEAPNSPHHRPHHRWVVLVEVEVPEDDEYSPELVAQTQVSPKELDPLDRTLCLL